MDMDTTEDNDEFLNNPLGLGLMDMNESIRGNIVLLDGDGNPIKSTNDGDDVEISNNMPKLVSQNSQFNKTENNWNFSETGTFQINSKTYGSQFYIKNGITTIQSNHQPSPIKEQNEEEKMDGLAAESGDANHIFTSMDQIEIQDTLGSGISGTVKKALHIPTKKQLALKYIDFHDKHKRKQFVDEMMLFLKFNHPNIVTFHGCCVDNSQYNGNVILGLEFMNYGSLAGFIKSRMKDQSFKFNNDQCKQLSRDIISALSYLEFNKIVHRDIKPENILVHFDDKKNDIVFKLADFGLNKCMESTVGFAKTQIGTLLYMSPERMLGKQYNWKSDIWSFGLVLIYCVNGAQSPYKQCANQGPLAVHMAIVDNDPPTVPENDGNNQPYSINLHSFVQACLYKDPEKRWKASDLLMHPFLME